MSTSSSVLKAGSHLVVGQIATQACSFIRNLIIARIVSPADFGIAATFAVTLSFMEMLSNVPAEMLLIQAPDGDNSRLQDTAHLLRAGRGLASAILLFAVAGPMSQFFGVPQARWAFQALGIFPLARGLSHLDIYRVQREMKFWPQVLVDLGANVLTTLAVVPIALWSRDYSAMLFILVIQAVLTLIGSFLFATRKYRWAWDKQYAKRILHFSWPLVINGLLMYGIFEGDRLIIGSGQRLFARSHFTLADLGVYSVAFALAMAPTQLIANISSSLFLPIFSQAQNNPKEFGERYLFLSQIISIIAMAVAVPFILGGGWTVEVLYGKKYAAAAGFIGWLAVMWGVRTFRVAPTVASIAKGDTRNSMLANIYRSLALVGMLFTAAVGGRLFWIAVCGFGGELLALAATVWRLERRSNVPASICAMPFAAFLCGSLVAGLAGFLGVSQSGPILITLTSLLIITATILGMFALLPNLRHDFRQLLSEHKLLLKTRKVLVTD